jgi:predicted CoA-binding protein
MAHPLEAVINEADGFIIIGDSSQERFPALSYAAYVHAKKRFYCLDLGGLTESRGPVKGGKVYAKAEEIPADHGDLAIVWVKPSGSKAAVDVAHGLGCRKVWFSFKTAHPDAVARARELGMEVVEVGRCPVYYLSDKPGACKAHTAMVKLSGLYRRPPEHEADAGRREIL